MGVNTNRDAWAYNHNVGELEKNVRRTLNCYNSERMRWHAARSKSLDELTNDGSQIKWSSSLKASLKRNTEGLFESSDIRRSLYRPFTTESLYFNSLLTHRRAKLGRLFPTASDDGKNTLICVPGPGNPKDFGVLATSLTPALDLAFEKVQCFPYYVFGKKDTHRRENITDRALDQFRSHYTDPSITKWDIFHYI